VNFVLAEGHLLDEMVATRGPIFPERIQLRAILLTVE
jgi:hypothetical protein